MKIRYINKNDVTIVAQMKLDHWQNVYRGMVDDEYLDKLTLEKMITEVEIYVDPFSKVISGLHERFAPENKETIDNISLLLEQIKIYALVVESEDSEIVGFCTFSSRRIMETSEIKFNGYDYQIHEIYVAPKYRKKGNGKKLIDFAFERINHLNENKILLMAHIQNKNAIDFYMNIGGTIIGNSEIELGDEKYPQIVIGFNLEDF